MHSVEIITIVALVTAAVRFLPFLIFPENKKVPEFLIYLSKVLPAAVMGMLVVYCYRNLNLMSGSHGAPEIISTGVVVLLYLWKKNFLISIAAGTILYMILVQAVFV